MDDKYELAAIGVVSLVAYGCVAMATGHNGSTMIAVVGAVVAVISGTIGFAIAGKKK